MYKEIFEIVFLTAYGKANLMGKNAQLFKNHPGMGNYRNMRFLTKEPTEEQILTKDIIAKDPNNWFAFLKKNGYTNLQLVYNPNTTLNIKSEYKQIFEDKTEMWYIFANKEAKYDVWKAKWHPENGETKSSYYLLQKEMIATEISFPSLATTKQTMELILKELIEFTTRNRLNNWKEVFQKALAKFTIKNSEELISEEYFPTDCYGIEAKQIFAACDQAWVFGGMGSWNDVVQVDNYDDYRKLTNNLYDTINNAIAAAVNSYP